MGIDGGDEKRTRFPCLDRVRYMVTAVVVVLTVAVAVMVITVIVHRPEDIELSILHGHIEASTLWRQSEIPFSWAPRYQFRRRRRHHHRPCDEIKPVDNDDAAGSSDISCAGESGLPSTIVTYEAAASVEFAVTLSAYNPSGRADINCTGITLRVVDMSDLARNTTGAMEVVRFPLPRGFLVRRRSSHAVRRWVRVTDARVLAYLASTYAGRTSFPATVQVNVSVALVTTVVKRTTNPKNVNHWCSVVTVGLDEPSTTADAVRCWAGEEPPYLFGSVLSAPPPAS
ncbi:uncharacterized protein LOC120702419 [Panicum virgatum]|uniref:Uncharacterized protein n=1 Tax=Panicum virgatum TaxID=38727 RepID=A0A8T0TIW1_PANVG|nr:uncharacterized protein LOC120702419 [Panicum virgatum]KAG2609013.1 hypothetical protein PVAP13_4KG005448 [Panicum virgatum]